ncbi:hypothetical protein D3C77_700650 [compost metagenome]
MEVSELTGIPEGMLGFTIPAHTYGKGRSEDDPYAVIHDYLQKNGMTNNKRAAALEIYNFENQKWPDQVDVYIPIEE